MATTQSESKKKISEKTKHKLDLIKKHKLSKDFLLDMFRNCYLSRKIDDAEITMKKQFRIEIIKQIENMTDLQIKQSIEISEKIERKCKLTAVKGKYGMQYTYNIIEETVLNLLRTLWVKTSNKFVKDVLKTVGVSKKISDKQLEIISDELALLSITF